MINLAAIDTTITNTNSHKSNTMKTQQHTSIYNNNQDRKINTTAIHNDCFHHHQRFVLIAIVISPHPGALSLMSGLPPASTSGSESATTTAPPHPREFRYDGPCHRNHQSHRPKHIHHNNSDPLKKPTADNKFKSTNISTITNTRQGEPCTIQGRRWAGQTTVLGDTLPRGDLRICPNRCKRSREPAC